MQVSSEGLGKGATFVIELPMIEVDEPMQEPLTPRLKVQGSDEAEDGELRIFTPLLPVTKYLLVVDDATSNRKLLVRILKSKGYVCREAADGQQALDVYQQMCVDDCAPCAVLMDFEMPVMNGPTATKHLREMGCDSYIVGVTGNVLQEDMDVFHERGANAVLAKPLRIEVFESMMARARVYADGNAQNV
ncbi:CheY-like superfamily [Ochromonadaceae sp. CCMP2298]|nr:CheY-like superfamily [Ochromonadaceae sp. CCMP2298]